MRSIESGRLFLLVVLMLALAACATTRQAPRTASFANADKDPWGGWAEIRFPPKPVRPVASGELIAVSSDEIILLNDTGVVRVKKDDIAGVDVTLYEPATLIGRVGPGMLLALTNGYFAVGTISLWGLAGGMALNAVENLARISFPEKSWDALRAGARFPQGLPPELDLATLRQRPHPKQSS